MPNTPHPNRAVALALSTHPGPSAAVTAIAVILGLGLGLEPLRLVALGLAFAFNQASVGLSNDWIDAERDTAVGRQDKPVARGWISASAVRTAAFASAAFAIAFTLPLGLWAALAHTVFIASAWAYNIGLKNTPISVLPYIVSFGLLPMVVTLARPEPAVAAPWAVALGALLGVAAHFANVLPDLADDRATGVRGLPHRLGRRRTGLATYLVLAAASVLAVVGPTGPITVLQWAGLAIDLGLAVTGIVLVLSRPPERLLFQLIIAAALVDVVLLAFAGQRLLV
ncbi:MAG: UbiA family prenyltransferase [Lacisediminihabitans sp.]